MHLYSLLILIQSETWLRKEIHKNCQFAQHSTSILTRPCFFLVWLVEDAAFLLDVHMQMRIKKCCDFYKLHGQDVMCVVKEIRNSYLVKTLFSIASIHFFH